jgi:serine/threonine protein kinase
MKTISSNLIQATPDHRVYLADEILQLVDNPQQKDFVIRRVSRKMANGQPLIQGELVVSGCETRSLYPLAVQYPVHFRKTYYPTCFHQNPEQEYNNHLLASQILQVAPPIGHTKTTFRSCFIPGVSYQKLTPFGVEPIMQNLQIGEDVPPASLIGLWQLLDELHGQVKKLHAHGLAHGDLYLHNVFVTKAPIGVHMIDFELAKREDEMESPEKWEDFKTKDLTEILQHAIYLQCALGFQKGPLAEESEKEIDQLFPDGDAVRRKLRRTIMKSS